MGLNFILSCIGCVVLDEFFNFFVFLIVWLESGDDDNVSSGMVVVRFDREVFNLGFRM